MNIAICEDTLCDVNNLTCVLNRYARLNNISITIDTYASGEDLIVKCADITYDIIFMDIYLPNITGVEVAKKIRKLQKCNIVFLTTSPDFALEAFSVDALHYIVKPIKNTDIEEVLLRLNARISTITYPPIEVKTREQIVYINPLKIRFIESYNKITIVHTNKNDYESYTTLSTFESLLDKELFIKPQRSYIVNMEYIDFISKDNIVLTDNTQIMLSRTNRKENKEVYEQFLFRQIREGKR